MAGGSWFGRLAGVCTQTGTHPDALLGAGALLFAAESVVVSNILPFGLILLAHRPPSLTLTPLISHWQIHDQEMGMFRKPPERLLNTKVDPETDRACLCLPFALLWMDSITSSSTFAVRCLLRIVLARTMCPKRDGES